MQTVTYTVPGIHCGHCIHTIKMEVAELPGVTSVEADLLTKQVTVVFDTPASTENIEDLLVEINYPAKK